MAEQKAAYEAIERRRNEEADAPTPDKPNAEKPRAQAQPTA